MSKVTIYHNPRCSKSRQTLALLEDNGVKPEIVEYLQTPPSVKELTGILEKLGMGARQLMRTKEVQYKENNLDSPGLSEQELIDAMIAYPKLMERPIVVKGAKAAVGRPPEKVLEIL